MRYFMFLCFLLLLNFRGKTQDSLLLKKWRLESVDVNSMVPGIINLNAVEYNTAIDSGFITPVFEEIDFFSNDSCKILIEQKEIITSYKIINNSILINYNAEQIYKYKFRNDTLVIERRFQKKPIVNAIVGYNAIMKLTEF